MNYSVWFFAGVAAFLLFQIVAIPALILKRNDYADVLWGPAFPLSALAGMVFGGVQAKELDVRVTLLVTLVSVWALRLFLHVGRRNLSHRTEDVRYANWRKQWGSTWIWRSYLQVFVLQAVILYGFLTPILHALASPKSPMTLVAWMGCFVWIVGFTFEALADRQLRRFKADIRNKGKLMTRGLWSWSRHPNYFGEIVQWWGIWLLVIDLPTGWMTIISPLGVTYLIVRVSGVSMLEDLMQKRPGYTEYVKKTSRLIPLPPR